MKTSPQLQLFPIHDVTWETLTTDCQQSVRELLSLLLEQAVRQPPANVPEHNQRQEENHV